jgi:hypothetical protein
MGGGISKTEADDAYIDQAELDAYLKDYATQKYLQDYYTKAATDEATQSALDLYTKTSDLSPYSLSSNADNNLNSYLTNNNYAKFSDIEESSTKLQDYLVKDYLPKTYQPKGNYQPAGNYALTSELANYQPKGNYALTSELANYAKLTGDLNINNGQVRSNANSFGLALSPLQEGPRLRIGSATNPSEFMEVGAWANRNNLSTKNRPLMINSDTSTLFYGNPNGNVGIGNTNPMSKLDVSGNIRSSGVSVNDWTMEPVETDLCFRKGNITVGCIDQNGNYKPFVDPDMPVLPQLAASDKFVTGRYVSIGFPNNVKGTLNLYEMEVIDNRGVVVSYGKPVSGKNILPNSPGSRLTDINYAYYKSRAPKSINTVGTINHDAQMVDSGLAHSMGTENGEYFEIDLGAPTNISYISILNRGANNTLADRIKGAVIIISTTPNRGTPVYTSDPISTGDIFIEVAPPSKTILRKHFNQHYGLT